MVRRKKRNQLILLCYCKWKSTEDNLKNLKKKKASGHITYSWYNTDPRMFPLCHENGPPLTNWHFWSFCLPSHPAPPHPYHSQHKEGCPLESSSQHSPLRTSQETQPGREHSGTSLDLHLFFRIAPFHIHPPPIYQSKLHLTSPIPNLTWCLLSQNVKTWAAKPRDVWNTAVDLRKQMVSKDWVIYTNGPLHSCFQLKLKDAFTVQTDH